MHFFARERFFEETPAARRRLVILLYVLVGPIFSAILFSQGGGVRNPAPLAAVVGLITAGGAWLILRPAPKDRDWIFPVAISPTVCCGIAFAACGVSGTAFLGVLGAPLAWAAVLFAAPVALAAWLTASLTCFAVLSLQGSLPAAAANALLLSTIYGLVGWVVYRQANELRRARSALQRAAERDRALLLALPDTLALVDREGRFLDVHGPAGDALPLPRAQLLGREFRDFLPPEAVQPMDEALARAFSSEAVQTLEYSTRYGEALRHFEARLARSGDAEVLVIRRDVTERRRAEEERRLLAALVDRMQEAVVATDPDLRIRTWAGASEATYGWRADEVLGRDVVSLLQPELPAAQARAFTERLAGLKTDRVVLVQRRKDGTPITAEVNFAALSDGAGELAGFLAVARDVTASKAAEGQLRESEERYRSLVEGLAEGIVQVGADGVALACNPAAERILGIGCRALREWSAERPPWDAIREDGSPFPVEERPLGVALRTGETRSNEILGIKRADGSLSWLRVSARPLRHAREERPYAVVMTFADITEQRRQAAELVVSQRRLSQVLEGSDDAYFDADLRTGAVARSPRLAQMLGLRPEEIAAGHDGWRRLVHPEDLARTSQAHRAHLAGRAPQYDVEYRMRAGDGRWKWMRTRAKVVEWDPSGAPVRLAGTISDIDALRRDQEGQLQAARLLGLERRINEIELVVRPDGSLLQANDRAASAYGYDRDELRRLHIRDLRAPHTLADLPAQLQRAQEEGGVRFETEHRRRDGTTFPVEVSSRAVRVGAEVFLHSLVRDLTEQRLAEKERALLAGLVRTMQDAVLITDAALRITSYTGAAPQLFGWSEAEVLGRRLGDDLPLTFPDGDEREQRRRILAGEPIRAYVRQQRKDGAWLDLDLRASPLRDAGGALAGAYWVSRDISERKGAERALRESEERYRSVVAASDEGIIMRRADGAISACNPAAERIFGLTERQLGGLDPTDDAWYTVREDGAILPAGERPSRVALRTGAPQVGRVMGIHKPDGTLTWVSANAQPLFRDGEPAPFAVVSTYRDVTRERAAAQALARSEERLRLALSAALQVEWDYDVQRQLRRGSRFGAGAGEDEVSLSSWRAQIHPDDLAGTCSRVEDCLAGRSPRYESEFRVRRPEGGWRWVRSRGQVTERDAEGRPLRMLGTWMDTTEVHALQEQLLAATRFASVGTLAAGVAHEVNNPLAWVMSNVSYALERVAALEEAAPLGAERRADLRELLDEALQGCRRIRDIVKAMRSLGRPETADPPAAVDVRAELQNALQMVGNQLAQRARLEVDLPGGLPRARAKTNELSRVFLNLLLNAAQAIPEGQASQNRIGVRASASGAEIVVAFSDTGVGMGPEVRGRIFDPFFTTKPVGVATGLGLTIARSIVEGAGGRIEVESEEGRGATFRVHLPALGPEPVERQETADLGPRAQPRLSLLIIDDEPLVGRALKRLLRDAHEVTSVTSAVEALRRIDAGERWDAMLCDVMMPDLDGIGFYEALAERHPGLLPRLAFISGGVFGDRAAAFLASHEVLVIAKPIERGALLRALRRVARPS